MAYEDIEVRITRSGEIYVKVEGSGEERLRDYFTFLEETVGPVRAMNRIDRPDWDAPASLSADALQEDEERRRQQELGG